jgi:hypothetical protein
MKEKQRTEKTRWELFCGILMIVALVITVIGAIVFIRPRATNGPMSGLGDGLFFIVWIFGLIGLVFCYVENATGKKQIAIIGFGWSALSLIWDVIAHKCDYADESCSYDTSHNGWMLAICISVFVVLLFYDKTKDKIPTVGKLLIKVFARSMVVVWACALLFSIAMFNKPLPLRIDRTAHPITPQEIQSEVSGGSK